jgi:hypothetical protein
MPLFPSIRLQETLLEPSTKHDPLSSHEIDILAVILISKKFFRGAFSVLVGMNDNCLSSRTNLFSEISINVIGSKPRKIHSKFGPKAPWFFIRARV